VNWTLADFYFAHDGMFVVPIEVDESQFVG